MAAAGEDGDRDPQRAAAHGAAQEAAGGSRPQAPSETEALTWFVYALIDPRDEQPRYIGCTKNLRAREREHCSLRNNSGRRKVAWVRELHALGLKPAMRVLAGFVDLARAEQCEQSHIDDGFERGLPLLNRAGSARSPHGPLSVSTIEGAHGPLTLRQIEVLGVIDTFTKEAGYPPTIRELGVELRINSTNAVNDHLKALERGGVITRRDQAARSIVITPRGRVVLGEAA